MEMNRKKLRESGFPKLTQNWNPSDFGSWLYIIGIVENNRLKSRVVINGGKNEDYTRACCSNYVRHDDSAFV